MKDVYGINQSLKYLNISKSSFYYKSKMDVKDMELKEKIELIMSVHESYGHKRVADELKLNKKKVLRIMKKYKLEPKFKRRKPFKYDVNKGVMASPNLIQDYDLNINNNIWVTDFTYLKWKNSFIYVCTVMDIFTREIIGINIKNHHRSNLVMDALKDAVKRRNMIPFIIHSDQGSEYKSKAFRDVLNEFNIKQSMSKKGSPWQNGFQESFYSNWKIDIGDVSVFKTISELLSHLYQSFWYYNNVRIHTALHMAPVEFAEKQKLEFVKVSKLAKKYKYDYDLNTKE